MGEPVTISTNEDLKNMQKKNIPRRPRGLISPEEYHKEKFTHEHNLNLNQDIIGSLDFYMSRCKQLTDYAKQVKAQAEKEVNELKEMIKKIGEENLRLKKLLKEKGN